MLIHSFVNRHLHCFHVLVIVSNVTINMKIQISFQDCTFNSFEYILRSEIARLYDNSIFNFLKNHHTVFHKDCTILHSHQKYTKVLISPHSYQRVLFFSF